MNDDTHHSGTPSPDDRSAAEPAPSLSGLAERTSALAADVEHLRSMIEPMVESMVESMVQSTVESVIGTVRRELAECIRTRRVEVVDDRSFRRVVISAERDHGTIEVHARGTGDGTTCVDLWAFDPIDHDPARVGLSLVDGGNVVTVMEVAAGAAPTHWLAADDDHPEHPEWKPGN